MTIRHSATVAQAVQTLFHCGAMGDWADGQLVGQFLAGREKGEAALEILLRRHGPMVLGVCRRILGDAHLAEDAFQSTFFVLVQKASRLQNRDLLANWLYGVAYRIARKAKAQDSRRRAIERQASASMNLTANEQDRTELRAVIDEEIRRLPERYRIPLVLCYMEGLHHHEAARRLGCPVGTVESRLSRARERLRSSLVRRGLAPTSTAVLAALTPSKASAAITPLIDSTLKVAALAPGLAGRQVLLAVSLGGGWLGRIFLPHAGATLTTLVVCAGIATAGLVAYRPNAPLAQPSVAERPPTPAVTIPETTPHDTVAASILPGIQNPDAHSRPVRSPSAVAVPLNGIVVDGQLDDWPKNLPHYPIRNRLVGHSMYDAGAAANPEAYFVVGYGRDAGLIYLAAVVRDEDSVAKAGGVLQTDALEVYIDGAFTDRSMSEPSFSDLVAAEMPALQYVALPGPVPAYDDPRGANPSLVYGRIDRTSTKMRFRHESGVTTYEWALQPFDQYPNRPTHLEPGKRIGLDVVVVDKDRSRARPSFLSWGASPRVFKGFNAGSLGELILSGNP